MIPFLLFGQDLCPALIRQIEGVSNIWSTEKSGHLLVMQQMEVDVNLSHAGEINDIFMMCTRHKSH
ncbi:hypothetical protein [Desulfopila sp. IMCC35008]|uniref:hypothetical protein n=1 Tax=Desulfopila sp. IMCC35008 TaxID=2653858 RepID=UPI002715410F|nr:hypothetical protein [Desulfopila sp. IMCC35008]